MDDDLSVATLNARMCALPDSDFKCFSVTPKRCRYQNGPLKGARCEKINPNGAYPSCPGQGMDSGMIYQNIITTHLNEACDVLGPGDLCNTLRRSTVSRGRGPAGVTTVSPGPHGCGCSVDGTDGAFASASLAGLVALLLHKRRRRFAS